MTWSLVAGVLGMLVSWGVLCRLAGRPAALSPLVSWGLGLAAVFPAWLVAFLGLLGPSPVRRPGLSVEVAILSSTAAALLGVIVTDAAVRRLRESGRYYRPLWYWLLGLVALLPAWGMALLGLARGRS